MRFLLVFIVFIGFQKLSAQDTFSIIALDPETGEIGAAGASCVDGIANFGGIQLLNKILPGKGGVNAQAWVCINPHINLDNAIGQMQNEQSPQEIIDWLMENDACNAANFNPEFRQYGIVDFDANGTPRVAAFTGAETDDHKGHRTGTTYSIQGNILLGPIVLDNMETNFNNTEGTLAQKLMAAMQGANMAGADVRCLDRGTSSTSAFLKVYKATDSQFSPSVNLNILEVPFGEEPIDSLQVLFDNTVISATDELDNKRQALNVFPNPSNSNFQFEIENPNNEALSIHFFDTNGKEIHQASFTGTQYEINSTIFGNSQVVIYRLTKANGQLIKADKLSIL